MKENFIDHQKNLPKVSIIIPTFNRPDNICRAIESVLRQTYKNIEIIVVDDNGENTQHQILTQQTITRYIENNRVKYIKHKVNKNGSAARNTGIINSSGEFITFLDDDDEMFPQKIEKQLKVLFESNDNIGAVYCSVEKKTETKSSFRRACQRGNLQKQLLMLKWSFFTGSNPLFRKEVFNKSNVGLWDESFNRHQDWELMTRFFRKYEIVNIDEVLVIKHVDSILLRPSAQKYIPITEHFLNTFADDIKSYTHKDQMKIHYSQWMLNFFLAVNEKDFRTSRNLLKKALSYKRIPSARDIAKAFYLLFFKFHVR